MNQLAKLRREIHGLHEFDRVKRTGNIEGRHTGRTATPNRKWHLVFGRNFMSYATSWTLGRRAKQPETKLGRLLLHCAACQSLLSVRRTIAGSERQGRGKRR